MGDKKYELTNTSIEVCGVKLFQIKALKSFNDIKEGDLGGYVEGESNLSHFGNAWVSSDARVYGDACVYGNARVYGEARVSDNACVYGNARVSGDARVYGNARVYGDTRVYDNAKVYGDAWVCDNAWVYDNARVYDDALVSGDVRVNGDARVYGNAGVYGDAWVAGDLKLEAGLFFGYKKKAESINTVDINDDYQLIYKGCAKFGEDKSKHTITIDGKDIEISEESYEELRSKLT